MQRPAGEIHRLFGRVEHGAAIFDLERVGQLDAELESAAIGDGAQVREHRHGLVVPQVVLEGRVGHDHIDVPKLLVQYAAQSCGAQQRRVALDQRVQTALLQQVGGNALDLLRRTAVHRRERDVVG